MDRYPFSTIKPPNTLPVLREQRPTPEAQDEPAEPDLPHIGRLTAFFVIALVSIPALAIGALVAATPEPGARLDTIAQTALPADDADPVNGVDDEVITPTTARMAVETTPVEPTTNDVVFAAPADDVIDGPTPPSIEALDNTPVTATESIAQTVLTTWENDNLGDQVTEQQLIESEAASLAMLVDTIETVTGSDGQQVSVATLSSETGETRALLAVHLTDDGYAAAYLTAPLESFDDAVAHHRDDVESIRYEG